MILHKSMHPAWLSNSYLLADKPGGRAVFIDTGAPPEPLLEAIEDLKLTPTHILCTHHHPDHVAENKRFQEQFRIPVCGHPSERDLFGGLDQELNHGDEVVCGSLRIKVLHIPGHTVGQLAFLVNGAEVYTGDTLFRRSVGGTRGPGHATFADLKRSVMDILMKLPPGVVVHPGHTDPTTIGEEWEENPFVRMWRGADTPEETPCTVFGQEATLLLEAEDYDGGTKCWVRFPDGSLDLAPGSRVRKR